MEYVTASIRYLLDLVTLALAIGTIVMARANRLLAQTAVLSFETTNKPLLDFTVEVLELAEQTISLKLVVTNVGTVPVVLDSITSVDGDDIVGTQKVVEDWGAHEGKLVRSGDSRALVVPIGTGRNWTEYGVGEVAGGVGMEVSASVCAIAELGHTYHPNVVLRRTNDRELIKASVNVGEYENRQRQRARYGSKHGNTSIFGPSRR